MTVQKEQEIRIRPIIAADDSAVAAIVRNNLEQYQLNIPGTAYFDPELDHLSRFYGAEPEKRAYFVAENAAGQILGGCGLAEFAGFRDCAEIQKLYLADEAKGKGIGRRLLEQAEAQAEMLGYQSVYLETHTNLRAALRLYEKAGFYAIEKPAQVFHDTMNLFYKKELSENQDTDGKEPKL